MTIAKTLDKLPASFTDNNIDIAILDQTDLQEIKPKTPPPAGTDVSLYVLSDGAIQYDAYVEVRYSQDGPKVQKRKNRATVKLIVPQISTNSENGEVLAVDEAEFWYGFAVPADRTVTLAEIKKGLSSVYGLVLMPNGTAGDTFLDKLIRGITRLWKNA